MGQGPPGPAPAWRGSDTCGSPGSGRPKQRKLRGGFRFYAKEVSQGVRPRRDLGWTEAPKGGGLAGLPRSPGQRSHPLFSSLVLRALLAWSGSGHLVRPRAPAPALCSCTSACPPRSPPPGHPFYLTPHTQGLQPWGGGSRPCVIKRGAGQPQRGRAGSSAQLHTPNPSHHSSPFFLPLLTPIGAPQTRAHCLSLPPSSVPSLEPPAQDRPHTGTEVLSRKKPCVAQGPCGGWGTNLERTWALSQEPELWALPPAGLHMAPPRPLQ